MTKTKLANPVPGKHMELRAGDKGTLKGLFELHFGVTLELEAVIDNRVCDAWKKKEDRHILQKNIGRKELSPAFTKLFDKHFRVVERREEYTTVEQCEQWRNKLQAFLNEIRLRRSSSDRISR